MLSPLSLSKKKDKRKADRESKKAAAAAAAADDTNRKNYGHVSIKELLSANEPETGNWTRAIHGRDWRLVKDLVESMSEILLRDRIHRSRSLGNNVAFLELRDGLYMIQCILSTETRCVSKNMIKYARESIFDVIGANRESIVDVIGETMVAEKQNFQQVQITVHKLDCISEASPRPKALENVLFIVVMVSEGTKLARVNQDLRLDGRYLDLRTPTNQVIFMIRSKIKEFFRQYLLEEGFIDMDTPVLISGKSEDGAEVFTLDYKGKLACLSQSPQIHKQMAINGDLKKVFTIGPAFRAEDLSTNRHLCEFTGLVIEMELKKHYNEVIDLVDRLFMKILDAINMNCKEELNFVSGQYSFEPLKYKPRTVLLRFEEGIEMLKDAGVAIDPMEDLSTMAERKLCQLVLEKHETDFFILYRYPLAARPFFTMPSVDNPIYSNSFNVFMRGEEIMSGAERIHNPEKLANRAQECGIDITTEMMSKYVKSFRHGSPLQGGMGRIWCWTGACSYAIPWAQERLISISLPKRSSQAGSITFFLLFFFGYTIFAAVNSYSYTPLPYSQVPLNFFQMFMLISLSGVHITVYVQNTWFGCSKTCSLLALLHHIKRFASSYKHLKPVLLGVHNTVYL